MEFSIRTIKTGFVIIVLILALLAVVANAFANRDTYKNDLFGDIKDALITSQLYVSAYPGLQKYDQIKLPDQDKNDRLGKLYLGSVCALEDMVRNNDISSIKLIISAYNNNPPKILTDYYNIKSLYYNVRDENWQNIQQYFDEAVKFMHGYLQRGQSVFVHCLVGISRSASFVIAYFIKYYNMGVKDAL